MRQRMPGKHGLVEDVAGVGVRLVLALFELADDDVTLAFEVVGIEPRAQKKNLAQDIERDVEIGQADRDRGL